jgi:hypothetical protein
MNSITFALLLVLNGNAPAVLYFPSRDLCEAAARDVRAHIPGDWRHVCLPVIGSATR